jgi:hypothetical protein
VGGSTCTLEEVSKESTETFALERPEGTIHCRLATSSDADLVYSYLGALVNQPSRTKDESNQTAHICMIFGEIVEAWADGRSSEDLLAHAEKLSAPNESSSGYRLTLRDEIADDLRSIVGYRSVWERVEERTADEKNMPYCLACDGTCDFGEEHDRTCRQKEFNQPLTWADLEELSRPCLIAETTRLRKLLPIEQVFPQMPPAFAQASERYRNLGWHTSTFGHFRYWKIQRPDSRRHLFFQTRKEEKPYSVDIDGHSSRPLDLEEAHQLLSLPEGTPMPKDMRAEQD